MFFRRSKDWVFPAPMKTIVEEVHRQGKSRKELSAISCQLSANTKPELILVGTRQNRLIGLILSAAVSGTKCQIPRVEL
jgi:hypothetical protein